jgi:hypothetical protein
MDSKPSDDLAAIYPGWVMLNHHGLGRRHCFPADANNTVASCLSSAGKRIHASFHLAAPPGNSALFLDWPDVRDADQVQRTEVSTAHGDSVLIQSRDCTHLGSSAPFEYFVYRAGGGPPSMSPLPPCCLPMPWEGADSQRRSRLMGSTDTGLLRRGEDDLVVAQLIVMSASAEFCVLRSDSLPFVWESKRPSVVYAEGAKGDELNQWWGTDAVVPIGDQFLCWVDYFRGLLLCDMFDLDNEPVLQYVPLPLDPNQGRARRDLQQPFKNARNIGTTTSGAVRFVSVDRRCCCGGLLESSCPRSRFSFTVTTWTLGMDSMTWSTDGMLHSDELWALPGYEGLPRVTPEFPVLSMYDDAAICLMVRHYDVDADDIRIWMIKVDAKSKTLLSIVPYNSARYKPMDDDEDESQDHFDGIGFIPSEVSKYLNYNTCRMHAN